ncbi:MAG: hypothetical protein HOH19_15185 [Kordiimonadaceae bacterium]|mgnify:CR=1 FL=1|jgi:hypothetical protein|nr:hypothetical protein [Kordiimonadaceae bacterium]MBT6033914.1 hypothetical protein [Kordiimonadaceae bacterium]
MNKSQPERKPLRQRVADRKRGIKEVVPLSERMEKFYKYLKLFFTTCQYLGLILLLFSLGTIVTNEFMVGNWDMIVIYSAMFIIGRAGLTIMSTILKFK